MNLPDPDSLPAGFSVISLQTPTLPPATHTNTWIVGHDRLTIFDPASPDPREQEHLLEVLCERQHAGEKLERIVLTHHHLDHIGGVLALKQAFPKVPVFAHSWTAEALSDRVDSVWPSGTTFDCGGVQLSAWHTPGHAPGHLVFHDSASNTIIAGDMVAGIGTILIDPRDGNLEQYLNSLEQMRQLRPVMLLPAHGPALTQAEAVLGFYIAHRHQRTEQIRAAIDRFGQTNALELAQQIYRDLPPEVQKVGAIQITSHLLWLESQQLAKTDGQYWSLSHH